MKCRRSLLTILALLALSTSGYFTDCAGANSTETRSGHRENRSNHPPWSIITTTEQPGFRNIIDPNRLIPDEVPERDEGEGEELWTITDPNAISSNVVISNDGKWVAIGYSLNDQRLEVRNGDDGSLVFDFPVGDGSSEVDMTADGEMIAYTGPDSVWIFWNDPEGVPFFRFGMEGYFPSLVRFSDDGEYFICAGIDLEHEENRAWCFRYTDPDSIWTFDLPYSEAFGWYGAQFSPENGTVLINGKFRYYLLDIETGEKLWEAPTYNTESSVVMSADGAVLVIGSLTGVLVVYTRNPDGCSYSELWRYRFQGARSTWVSACDISADGSTIAAGTLDFFDDRYEGRIALFDTYLSSSPLWITEPLGDEVSDIAVSPDGSIIAAVSWGDVQNLRPDLMVHERHNSEPFYMLSTVGSLKGVDISSDGRRVVAGGKGTHSRVFGRGGIVKTVSITIPGGRITGKVTDRSGTVLEGAEMFALDNPYTAATDDEGKYELLIETNGRRRDVDVEVRLKGYFDTYRRGLRISEGEIITDVDFQMSPALPPPQNVNASQGQRNRIVISWDSYVDVSEGIISSSSLRTPHFVLRTQQSKISHPGITPWDSGSECRGVGVSGGRFTQADNINIYRAFESGGPYGLIGTDPGNSAFFIDGDGLLPGKEYYYVVTADFWDGESAYSDEVIGWMDASFLASDAELESMPSTPQIDGSIEAGEWEGAVIRDISDLYGFDDQDSAGSVEVRIGFCRLT